MKPLAVGLATHVLLTSWDVRTTDLWVRQLDASSNVVNSWNILQGQLPQVPQGASMRIDVRLHNYGNTHVMVRVVCQTIGRTTGNMGLLIYTPFTPDLAPGAEYVESVFVPMWNEPVYESLWVDNAYASDGNCPAGAPPPWGIYTCRQGELFDFALSSRHLVAVDLASRVGCAYGNPPCPATQTCVNNECVTPPPSCQTNSNCPPGQLCIGGTCITPQGGCNTNADCQPGYVCVNGQCVLQPPTGCKSDGDCPPNFSCVGGQCVPISPGGFAVSIKAKNNTTGAEAGAGQALAAKVGDSITVSGTVTENGAPITDTCSGCVSVCIVGGTSCFAVGIGSLGPGNYLWGPATIPSTSSFPIQATYTAPSGSKITSGQIMIAVGGGCSSNSDCPLGQICVNGNCVTPPPGCSSNNDCPTGYICVQGSCVPKPSGCGTGTIQLGNQCVPVALLGLVGAFGAIGLIYVAYAHGKK